MIVQSLLGGGACFLVHALLELVTWLPGPRRGSALPTWGFPAGNLLQANHSFRNACMQGKCSQGLLLKDKWALVTGASHGIGRALAEELARESAAVILTSDMLSQDGLDKVCIA